MGEFQFVPADGGRMHAYIALPDSPNGCGIILGSSVWGLNFDLRAVADGYAALGYAVIAPNMFWRLAPEHGVDYDLSRFDDVAALARSGSDAEGILDFRSAKAALQRLSGCRRVATIGWCYGGRISGLCAAEPDFDLGVAIYPTVFEKHLHIAERLHHPLALHLPEKEQYGTVEDAIHRIVEAFRDRPLARSYVYPGVSHGFDFAPPHPHANHAAARLCDNRVALALDRVLARGEYL